MKKLKFFTPFLIIVLSANFVFAKSTNKVFQNIDYKKYEKDAVVTPVLQRGHSLGIESLAFSPDGKYIASGSGDKTIKLWSINGQLVRSLEGHTDVVQSVAFNPNGKYIASGSADGTIKLWTIDGKLVRTLEGHSAGVSSVAFSPDGKYLASGYWNKTIKLWSIDGKLVKTLEGHSSRVSSVAFSPDGKYIASGSSDKTIKLWTIDGKLVRSMEGHAEDVSSVAFSPDGKYIASGSSDNTIKLWTISGKLVRSMEGHLFWVISVAFSPDGKYLASGSLDNTIKLWTVDGKLVETLNGLLNGVFSPDGKYIASASAGNTIELYSIKRESRKTIGAENSEVFNAAVSPDGKYIASGSLDNTIKLWSIDGKLVKTLKGHSKAVSSVAFSPDSKYIASSSWDKTIKLWSIDGELKKTLEGHSADVNSVAFSPDGEYIVSGSDDKTIKLWSIDGELEKTLEGHTEKVRSVAFSPNGKYVASGSNDQAIKLWTIKGKLVRSLEGHSNVVSNVVFSPDGKYIASGSWDKTIKLWSIEGELAKTLEGHSSRVTSVAFSPDGKYIASGSWDTTIKLWSIDGELKKTMNASLGNWSNTITFNPDGKYIVSAASNGGTMYLDVRTGKSVSAVAYDEGEWFMIDNEGHFDCSSNGKKSMLFVKGFTVYQPDQFWDSFYTPNLLQLFIAGEKLSDVDIDKIASSAPIVNISTPENNYTSDTETVTVKVLAKPSSNGVGGIFLYHNGRVIDENSRGISVKKTADVRVFTVQLVDGENIFVGAAYDKGKQVEGRSDKVIVTYNQKNVEKPDMYVISIGISDYKDTNISLKSPNKDAKDIAKVFNDVSSSLYGNVYPTVITDSEANNSNLIKTFNKISEKVKVSDTVIIFMAGHGIIDNGVYYYLTYDTDLTDIAGTALSIKGIEDFIKKLSANKVAIFMDTCQSGAAVKNLGLIAMSRSVEEKRMISRLAKDKGVSIISAASETQKAYEIKALKNGILTYSIVNVLKNKKDEIKNKNGISIHKLLSVVNSDTRDTAYEYLKIEQSPVVYTFGDDFSIGISK